MPVEKLPALLRERCKAPFWEDFLYLSFKRSEFLGALCCLGICLLLVLIALLLQLLQGGGRSYKVLHVFVLFVLFASCLERHCLSKIMGQNCLNIQMRKQELFCRGCGGEECILALNSALVCTQS